MVHNYDSKKKQIQILCNKTNFRYENNNFFNDHFKFSSLNRKEVRGIQYTILYCLLAPNYFIWFSTIYNIDDVSFDNHHTYTNVSVIFDFIFGFLQVAILIL